MWALGVLMYECLVGKPPFEASESVDETHSAIVHAPLSFPPEVSLAARSLIEGLLQKEAGKRLTLEQVLQHPFIAAHAA